jgi:hypothetical protein
MHNLYSSSTIYQSSLKANIFSISILCPLLMPKSVTMSLLGYLFVYTNIHSATEVINTYMLKCGLSRKVVTQKRLVCHKRELTCFTVLVVYRMYILLWKQRMSCQNNKYSATEVINTYMFTKHGIEMRTQP